MINKSFIFNSNVKYFAGVQADVQKLDLTDASIQVTQNGSFDIGFPDIFVKYKLSGIN